MKTETIGSVPNFSWKKRIGIFLGVLGGFWTVLQPLASFVAMPNLFALAGVWGYLILVIVALLVTASVEYIARRRSSQNQKYIKITVLVTTDGTQHSIKVPSDMNVGTFVELFLDHLSSNTTTEMVKEWRKLYKFNLLVMRQNDFDEVSSLQTLNEVGIKEGDVCKVKGNIQPQFKQVFLGEETPEN